MYAGGRACMCACVYVRTCVRVRRGVCGRVHVHAGTTCAGACAHGCLCIHACVCVTHVHMCVRVSMQVHVCARMYVFMCACSLYVIQFDIHTYLPLPCRRGEGIIIILIVVEINS